jgi:hypothetical protein
MSHLHDPDKPVAQLRRIAERLGWRGLCLWQHRLPDGLITWYSTTDEKFFLHINELPHRQAATYSAAVYADRYDVYVGWCSFSLANRMTVEALAPLLSRRLLKNRCWRRTFRERHPECFIDRPMKTRYDNPGPQPPWEARVAIDVQAASLAST